MEQSKNKKGIVKEGFLGILIIGFILLLVVGGSFFSLWHYGFFAPKYKAIEREVWEATPSRIEGATQEINKRYLEYNKGDSSEKEAICMYLRNSYPDITGDEIDDYRLRQFFENCKYGG